MNKESQNAKQEIEVLLSRIKSCGLSADEPVLSNYCYESLIKKEKEKVKLQVYFGKKGIKKVLQGNKDSSLHAQLSEIVFGKTLFTGLKPEELSEPNSYIGTDESGKGDFFGPLVIAGVGLDEQEIQALKKIGVKDSKALVDTSISKISFEIKKIIGNNFSIILITPETYNKLFLQMKNVNRILAWGHAKVIENILEKKNYSEAISDKFGDESLILNSLQSKGSKINLYQRTKAERYTAVAAASILARDKFNFWFESNSKELNIKLPKGASEKVILTANEIKSKFGEDSLTKYVKRHFKTFEKLT